MIHNAILESIGYFVTNLPYLTLLCALFWQQRRVSAAMVYLAMFGFTLLHEVISYFLIITFDIAHTEIQLLFFVADCVVLLMLLFRVSVWKALYSYLLVRAIYIAIINLVQIVFMLVRPDERVGFDNEPLFTLAVLLCSMAAMPFMWRYFTGTLREAFAEQDEKTLRQLCVPPLIFLLVDVCYTAIRNSFGYDRLMLQISFIFILSTGFVTHYVNLRMVIESVRRVRADDEMRAQLAMHSQAARVRADVIDTLSHEVRTPLTVMSVYAQLAVKQIQKGRANEQTAADLITISNEAKRISDLASHALKLSRLADKDAEPDDGESIRLDIGEITGQLCRLFAPMVKLRDRSLTVSLPGDLPPVLGDADSLTRLLWNLLDNALLHSGYGDIEIIGESDESCVRIIVKDSGKGIPPELMPRVFERGVSIVPEGTGLGLPICREIAGRHGGELRVESEYGAGTVVTLCLPLYREEGE